MDGTGHTMFLDYYNLLEPAQKAPRAAAPACCKSRVKSSPSGRQDRRDAGLQSLCLKKDRLLRELSFRYIAQRERGSFLMYSTEENVLESNGFPTALHIITAQTLWNGKMTW